MDFTYKPEHDYKYELASDGTRLVLKQNKTAKRFGGSDYLATHDFLFGAEKGWEDISICVLNFMQDFNDYDPKPKEFLRNFNKKRLDFLAGKSKHVREAIDEVIEMIELSMHHYERGDINPTTDKCRFEKLYEARCSKTVIESS